MSELNKNEIIVELSPNNEKDRALLELIFKREKVLYDHLTPLDEYVENDDGEFIKYDLPKQTDEQRRETIYKLDLLFPNLDKEADFQVSQDTIDFTGDVMALDDEFMQERYKLFMNKHHKYNIICFVLFEKSNDELIYGGHVWGYSEYSFPNFYGIYGMKTSIVNIVNKKNNYSATKLLSNGVYPKMIKENRTELIVPWPLPPMRKILFKLGFEEFNTEEMTEERKFLEDIASTTNYFTYHLE